MNHAVHSVGHLESEAQGNTEVYLALIHFSLKQGLTVTQSHRHHENGHISLLLSLIIPFLSA